MKKIYYYRYTTNPELIKEFGDNFFVREYEIEEESENEVDVKDYDYVRKEDIDNTDAILNECFHGEINYTWFSYNNDIETMNKFKDGVRKFFNNKIDKLKSELEYNESLLRNIRDSYPYEIDKDEEEKLQKYHKKFRDKYPKCPKCGSNNIDLFVFFAQLHHARCRYCGYYLYGPVSDDD